MASSVPTDIRHICSSDVNKEEEEFVSESKLSCGKFVIGWMLTLCCKPESGKSSLNCEEASPVGAEELRLDWIDKSVYPMEMRSVEKHSRNSERQKETKEKVKLKNGSTEPTHLINE